jgi:lipopolysaccharide/colanic/teichoic acid biosynthesis glycosyltransferase
MDYSAKHERSDFCTEIAVPAFSQSVVRVIDIVIATCLLVVLLPALLIIAILVFAADPGPVFFAHLRVGRGGVMFPCLKFRTMVVDAGQRLSDLLASDPEARVEWLRDHKLRNDPRITKFGNFLRKTSFDELPQLWNVVRGDMSLVGPRPITKAEVSRYGVNIIKYMAVRPGISGLWQISGRNDICYDSRVALDVAFFDSYSVSQYLKIALLTPPAVLFTRGSY